MGTTHSQPACPTCGSNNTEVEDSHGDGDKLFCFDCDLWFQEGEDVEKIVYTYEVVREPDGRLRDYD